MTLEEMTDWLAAAARQHARWSRLQTGDPGLYGALIEMTRPLTAAGILGRGAGRLVGHGLDGGAGETLTCRK